MRLHFFALHGSRGAGRAAQGARARVAEPLRGARIVALRLPRLRRQPLRRRFRDLAPLHLPEARREDARRRVNLDRDLVVSLWPLREQGEPFARHGRARPSTSSVPGGAKDVDARHNRRAEATEDESQLSRKLRSFRLRLGCFSLRSALASIWRMRSRVTENCWPTSSSVWSVFMPMPKRMRSTRSSRGVSEASTRVVVSRRFDW